MIIIVLVPSSFFLSNHLFEDGTMLTTLPQFPTFCLAPLSTLLQTVISDPKPHFLVTHETSIHYLWTTSLTFPMISLLSLPQNVSFWTACYTPLKLHSFLPLMVTLWWNSPSDVPTAFLVPYSTSTSLLVPLFYFLFSNTYHNHPHIFLYLLLLLATHSFLSPTLSFSTFLYVLPPVYYNTTGLFLLSIPHSPKYTPFLLSIPSLLLSATYLLIIL